MTKAEQQKINETCEQHFNQAMQEATLESCHYSWKESAKRLRTCSAKVYETDNYYILQSYRTNVAVIDKRTDTLYDVLRIVYGYTSTSSQHIAKFSRDYGVGKWGCENRMVAR